MHKQIGELIDELIIINMKIWKCEDDKRNHEDNDKIVADACRKTNVLNPRRNALIAAINEMVGQDSVVGIKLYGR
jgi:hypothetical protein